MRGSREKCGKRRAVRKCKLDVLRVVSDTTTSNTTSVTLPSPFGSRPVVRRYTKAEFPYAPEEGY
jgi:hypothetical protein